MQRRVGKLLPKATGPFVFIRYKSPLNLTAELRDPLTGKTLECSLAHIIPA